MSNPTEDQSLSTAITNAETAAENRAKELSDLEDEQSQRFSAEVESMNEQSDGS